MAKPSKAEYWLTEDGLRLIRSWKRNDLKDAEIAEKIGIGASTFSEWKVRHTEISEALKKGLADCVADAEEALFSKFRKQEVQEQQVETWEETGAAGQTVTKTHKKVIKREVLPDTAAILFFLKCKAGWRENDLAGQITVRDDGFIEALGKTAAKDWNDGRDV